MNVESFKSLVEMFREEIKGAYERGVTDGAFDGETQPHEEPLRETIVKIFARELYHASE